MVAASPLLSERGAPRQRSKIFIALLTSLSCLRRLLLGTLTFQLARLGLRPGAQSNFLLVTPRELCTLSCGGVGGAGCLFEKERGEHKEGTG